MENTRSKTVPFLFAILFSLVLHLIALGGVKGFRFPDSFSPNIFLTSIESEREYRPVAKLSIGGVAGDALRKEGGGSADVFSDGRLEGYEIAADSEESLVQDGPETVAAQEPDVGGQGEHHEVERTAAAEEKGEMTPLTLEEPVNTVRAFREKLDFELYWLGVYVGKATLEAVNDSGTMKITSQARSAPFISTFYKVEDYAESRVVGGVPALFKIRQHEGKYRSNKETLFDPNSGKITYMDYLKDIRNEHDVTAPLRWDVISGFYYLRTQPLEVGKTFSINVFDSNKFLTVEVSVLGRERLELFDKREVDTVIVRPVLKSEGLFQKKGDVLIWLTDDESKVPVKVETEVPVGKIVAKLTGVEREK